MSRLPQSLFESSVTGTLPEELKLLKKRYCNALIGQRPLVMEIKGMDVLSDIANVRPEQIESENDDDEKECSKVRAMLKVVGRGSVRTGRRASSARYGCPDDPPASRVAMVAV